jgi:hypothetical protein
VVLVAVGVLVIWFPWLLPGLHASAMSAHSMSQVRNHPA